MLDLDQKEASPLSGLNRKVRILTASSHCYSLMKVAKLIPYVAIAYKHGATATPSTPYLEINAEIKPEALAFSIYADK